MSARFETGRVSRIKRRPPLAKKTFPGAAALLQSVRLTSHKKAADSRELRTHLRSLAPRALYPEAELPAPWCPWRPRVARSNARKHPETRKTRHPAART